MLLSFALLACFWPAEGLLPAPGFNSHAHQAILRAPAFWSALKPNHCRVGLRLRCEYTILRRSLRDARIRLRMMSEDKLDDKNKLFLPDTASEPEDGLPVKGLEVKEKRLRKSLKNAVGALRDDLAKIRKESDSSILTRMGVGGSTETAKRGTSTTFLVEELKTDDGLTLSGNLLLEARSNWVRDLLSTGNSLLLQRIADRLGFVGAWAIGVSLFFSLSPPEWQVRELVQVPSWPHELIGGFLSILLVFRTDQAYQRFWAGRSMWADVAGHLRSMAMVAVTVLDGEVRDVVMAHLCVFPVMLKQHLRGERSGQEINSIFEALGVQQSWRARGIQLVLGSNNMPLTLLTSLSSQLRGANSVGTMTREDLALFKESISSLAKILSECEKLRCTPIPLSYSRHTSRFFTLFSLSLPFSLNQDMSPLLVAPVVVFVSWILFATEEIGLIIEEPFGRGLQPPASRLPLAASEEELKRIFDTFDVDLSGQIDKTELFLALDRLGIQVRAADIEQLVRDVDVNNNELIEFDEFCQVVAQTMLTYAGGESTSLMQRVKESSGGSQSADIAAADTRMGDPYTADGLTPTAGHRKYTLAGLVFTVLVRSIFELLSAIWGNGDVEISTSQLEVLPLDRYVYGMQRDILQQAAFMAGTTAGQGAQRQRYMKIASAIRQQGAWKVDGSWKTDGGSWKADSQTAATPGVAQPWPGNVWD